MKQLLFKGMRLEYTNPKSPSNNALYWIVEAGQKYTIIKAADCVGVNSYYKDLPLFFEPMKLKTPFLIDQIKNNLFKIIKSLTI
jgi:hypothetical protein